MSGPELAGAVRGRRPDTRIVLTSGYVGEADVPSGFTFVPKPYRMDHVAPAVGLRGSQFYKGNTHSLAHAI